MANFGQAVFGPTGSRGGRLSSGRMFDITVDGKEGVSDLGLALQGRLQEVIDAEAGRIAKAYQDAMAAVVAKDKSALQADIAGAGFHNGGRLAKTWRGQVFPKNKPSMEPAAYLWNKAGVIVDAFSEGVTITVKDAQFLAIPLPPAKAIIRRLNLGSSRSRTSLGRFAREDSPVARVAQTLGVELVAIVSRDGQHGVLVAQGKRLTRGGRLSKSQRGPDTPLFVLTKHATLKKRLKGMALVKELEVLFQGDFVTALATKLAPENKA